MEESDDDEYLLELDEKFSSSVSVMKLFAKKDIPTMYQLKREESYFERKHPKHEAVVGRYLSACAVLFKCFSSPSELCILNDWIIKEELKEFLTDKEIMFIHDNSNKSLPFDFKNISNFKINGNFTKCLPLIAQESIYLIKICIWAFKKNNSFGEIYDNNVIDVELIENALNNVREQVNVDEFRRETILIGPDHIELRHKQIELQVILVILFDMTFKKLVDDSQTEINLLKVKISKRYKMFSDSTWSDSHNVIKNLEDLLATSSEGEYQAILDNRKAIWIVFNWLLGIGNKDSEKEEDEKENLKYLPWNDTLSDCTDWIYKLIYNKQTKLY